MKELIYAVVNLFPVNYVQWNLFFNNTLLLGRFAYAESISDWVKGSCSRFFFLLESLFGLLLSVYAS